MRSESHRIGFVSTRLAGTDGVSLETAKWVQVLERLGHQCFYFAGESEWPAARSVQVPEAHFSHPEIQQINTDLFDNYRRSPETSRKIHSIKLDLLRHLHRFKDRFGIELMVVENALSIPMNIPLGLALTELIAETSLPTLAHHHDFFWERERFSVSAADDYLRAAFPPTLYSIRHVVINSYAGRHLALRTGVSSVIIPNVMDFDTPPSEKDQFSDMLRQELGIPADHFLLLQPTRIVPRKRIEIAIELASRLGLACSLVISHQAGDEGSRYEAYLQEFAQMLEVEVLFAADRFDHSRGRLGDGRPVFSLADAYQQADLVTYPSRIEGFGNAFLESLYFRKPILMGKYEIFRTDIQPKGFQVIGFEDYLTAECVQNAREILTNASLAQQMVSANFELARRHYSFRMLESQLHSLVSECMGL